MTDVPQTHEDVVAKAVEALGGIWDAQRAATTLRDSGHEPVDQRAAEKEARRVLRRLESKGALVKIDPVRAVYRSAV
ncbi:hypothetical protein ABZ464_28715 [Streptomyces sp. NPDC005820]|uniref:hypothetical protein n=1 Tax=Streptomyces sp. NPDC005820 TaxID=3157069 RepID=UPI0033CA5652